VGYDHRIATGYLLTAIAGWVDAQGFLALQGVFVSFMTGNTTLLGLALAPGHWGQVGPIALVIGLFLAGGISGGYLQGAAGRWAMPAIFGCVAAVLAVAIALGAGAGLTSPAAMSLAFAMGVQNAASGAVGPVRTGVTYVTGTLVSAGQEIGKWVNGKGSLAVVGEHMSSWLALLVGVMAGAAADARVGLLALIVPCLAVAALALRAGLAVRRA
jgi:uncharacterized membrane protein YoaK (UPF0700 family)